MKEHLLLRVRRWCIFRILAPTVGKVFCRVRHSHYERFYGEFTALRYDWDENCKIRVPTTVVNDAYRRCREGLPLWYRIVEWCAKATTMCRESQPKSRMTAFLLAVPFFLPLLTATGNLTLHVFGWKPLAVVGSPLLRDTLVSVCILGAAVVFFASKQPIRKVRMLWPTMVLGLVALLTVLLGSDPIASILGSSLRPDSIAYYGVGALFAFVLAHLPEKKRLRLLGVAAIAGIATFMFVALDVSFVRSFRAVAEATFGNENFLSHYFLLLLGCVVVLVAHRARWWHGLAAAVFLLAIWLSGSYLSIFLAVPLVVFGGLLWNWRVVSLAVLIVAISGALFAGPTVSHYAHVAGMYVGWSRDIRIVQWKEAMSITAQHRPLFGYGWGNSDIAWNDADRDIFAMRTDTPERYDRVHNLAVEAFVGGGLALLAAFVWWWVALFAGAAQWARRDKVALAYAGVFVVALVYLLANFDTTMSVVIFGLLLGTWIGTEDAHLLLKHKTT